jgi:uncharacterized protein YijF (DUF1287 family)
LRAGACREVPSLSATRLLIEGAKQQIGNTLAYNPAYQKLAYPMGDLPLKEGVCTDVIIRAFRHLGIDLQQLIHEDMKRHWRLYPKKWGNSKPDTNIDHRRIPNLIVYFQRQSMTVQDDEYRPGDLVVWDLGGGILHIGLLSDKTHGKYPLVIHNICCGVKEEDILTKYKVVGHFRLDPSLIRQ